MTMLTLCLIHTIVCLDSSDKNTVINRSEECQRIGLWKCGHRFIRAHKFIDIIVNEESFESKCILRSAFFKCIEKWAKRDDCQKYANHMTEHSMKFRKRLTDTLWSTRGCLTGVPK
ncbi:unnamed protein product [Medioppia subpectinata]|uniref:Uncharacterized protein n=1 Tax=Medioppia subpectinata TaxID=1979941 RepID=A0A7R9KKK5_9ACAR|nr:unnamed protein product [Medioppia subpectinata]CAG2104945.1 unnamed protein product [Medioppia subpectinata]